jgi:hypothetical protein
VGHADAGLGHRAGRLRRADGDDEAVPGHRHAAPARRLGLLALLALQDQAFAPRPLLLSPRPARGRLAARGLLAGQVALGGWVSTNYAVLACRDFPDLPGPVVAADGLRSRLHAAARAGRDRAGEFLPFAALTAIHVAHRAWRRRRAGALALLAWRLSRAGDAALRRFALGLACSGCGSWPAACPTSCSAGPSSPRWRTPAARRCLRSCWLRCSRARIAAAPARRRDACQARVLRV